MLGDRILLPKSMLGIIDFLLAEFFLSFDALKIPNSFDSILNTHFSVGENENGKRSWFLVAKVFGEDSLEIVRTKDFLFVHNTYFSQKIKI